MLKFRKYHGLGNDFIVVEAEDGELSQREIGALCHRNRGVGADGVLLVKPVESSVASAPAVRMIVYNRDGSRPEMCGNGVRCVAAYAQRMWDFGEEIVVESDAGPRRCEIERSGSHQWQITVDMGLVQVDDEVKTFETQGRVFEFLGVDAGNPHAVIFEKPSMEVIDAAGALANADHPLFASGVNLEFVEEGEGGLDVVVFERGVGRTRACGTGACAVAAAAWASGRADPINPLQIGLPGGKLTIESRGKKVWMRGPAEEVFAGVWKID